MPSNVSVFPDVTEIGPVTVIGSVPVPLAVSVKLICVLPTECPVTVKVDPLGALAGLTVATAVLPDSALIVLLPCIAVKVPVPLTHTASELGIVLTFAASATSAGMSGIASKSANAAETMRDLVSMTVKGPL